MSTPRHPVPTAAGDRVRTFLAPALATATPPALAPAQTPARAQQAEGEEQSATGVGTALLEREELATGRPWQVIVWNDPVNLMSYVSYVFRSYFGYGRAEADRLMLQVHEQGRAVVSSGGREQSERHVQAMHRFGLWATMQHEND